MSSDMKDTELDKLIGRCVRSEFGDPEPVVMPWMELHTTSLKNEIAALIKRETDKARIDGAIMGAKFGNAAFRQYNIADPSKPINLDTVLNMGIEQARDWAERHAN